MMIKTIIAPGKYVQGNDVLKGINKYTITLGKSFFIIASSSVA